MKGLFGPLYLEALRFVRDLQPQAFIAENVPALLSAHNGEGLKQILHDFSRAGVGYEVTTHLFNCEQYGIPQARSRVVLVGIRRDFGLRFLPPAPTTLIPRTAGEALLAPLPDGCANAEPYRTSDLVRERLSHIRPGENIWIAQAKDGFPDHLRLKDRKEQRFALIYRRMATDRPAYTIVATGGGGTLGYHFDEPRPLTNRERARLQGFPDTFRFIGTPSSVRRQIGMSVPPPFAQTIAEALLKTLVGVAYHSATPNFDWKPEPLPRGRPRRLEAQPDAKRAHLYRQRRITENRLIAEVIRRAINKGHFSQITTSELNNLLGFIRRHTENERGNGGSFDLKAFSVTRQRPTPDNFSRSQRHRLHLKAELDTVKRSLRVLDAYGLFSGKLLTSDDELVAVQRLIGIHASDARVGMVSERTRA
ncbi:DNA-methyltransferase (dcm) [Faunimonas pinastri]|uniref:DNA (cytosine-5-)-methyltransferase n=2 Tax=Faunimonas pinastri TaxID=1855383 RepID=A0A1H9QHR7_9HYPH|nr:DNA-methyltransferase (dcm) [Faunimonas pinastri]